MDKKEYIRYSKKEYITPHTSMLFIGSIASLLGDSATAPTGVEWDPTGNGTTPPLPVTPEKDGNLGAAGSELTGAKGHTAWDDWEE